MGYMCHHAIVVTSWNEKAIQLAHQKATEIFSKPNMFGKFVMISPIIASPTNGYSSFFIPPDGSKEGWDESYKGDSNRDEFVDWLNSQRYEDSSSPFSWAEIQYGDEDGDNRITRNNRDFYHTKDDDE